MSKKMKLSNFVVLMLVLITLCPIFSASEIKSNSEVAETESPDQILAQLDGNKNDQQLIQVPVNMRGKAKWHTVNEIYSPEKLSVVNPKMYGRWGYYIVDDHIVFCIQPGINSLDIATSTSISGSVYNKFSSTSKQTVNRLISIGTEDYKKTDNEKYLFATQLLIWEYVSEHEASVIHEVDPGYLDGWEIDNSRLYSKEISSIRQELKQWNKLPSFLSSTTKSKAYKLKYDAKNKVYTKTLVDDNHIWDQKYAKYGTFGKYKLTNPKGADNVKIETTVSSNKPYQIKFTWTPYGASNNYFYDAGQDLVSVGAKGKSGYINLVTETRGGFELTKQGEQADGSVEPLSNIEFTVNGIDSDFSKIYATNEEGVIKTSNTELETGKYHIVESGMPNQYANKYSEDFEIKDNGKILALNEGEPIVNKLYTKQIEFNKIGESLDNNNDEFVGLVGASFDIYKEEGEPNQIIDGEDSLVETVVSDENGHVISGDLPIGNYVIVETAAPNGYMLNDVEYPIKIEKSNDSESVYQLGDIENELIKGKVSLTKIGVRPCFDDETVECSSNLEGVKFGIYQDTNSNGVIDKQEDKPIDVITTNGQGYGESTELKYGDYNLKEIDNPHEQYVEDGKVYTFSITENGSEVTINNDNPIVNNEKVSKINIKKYGEDLNEMNQIALEGAQYTIYDKNNNVVEVLTTDSKGEAKSSYLSYGNYSIVETKAPEGYVLDSSKLEFEINDEAYNNELEFVFKDAPITNEILISKVDAATSEELPGATITITNKKTDTVVDEWVSTTEPHQAVVKYGKYEICETIAPAGYKLSTECIDFDVKENGVAQKFTMENKLQKIAITGGDSKIIQVIVGLMLAMVILIIKYLLKFKGSM